MCVILVVNGVNTRGIEGLLPCRIVSKLLICSRHHSVEAHSKPIGSIVINASAEVKALVIVVSFHDTVLVKVVYSHRIGSAFTTSWYVHTVVSNHRFAQKLVIPIGITAVGPIVEVGICIATAEAIYTCFKVRIVSTIVGFHQHLSVLAWVCHLQYVGSLLYSYISIVRNLSLLVALSLLGGDNNHTICCAHTVDSGCRSVFKHAHILYIFAVKEVDIVIEHAINDVQRIWVWERACTTNTHCWACTGHTAVHYIHTRYFALHSCHWRWRRCTQQLFALHNNDRAGKVFHFGRTITYCNYFVKHFRVVC